jgi:predicted YcjX-like family ATPase
MVSIQSEKLPVFSADSIEAMTRVRSLQQRRPHILRFYDQELLRFRNEEAITLL